MVIVLQAWIATHCQDVLSNAKCTCRVLVAVKLLPLKSILEIYALGDIDFISKDIIEASNLGRREVNGGGAGERHVSEGCIIYVIGMCYRKCL